MKPKILKASSVTYEIVEQAFFVASFFFGYGCLFIIAIYLAVYFGHVENNETANTIWNVIIALMVIVPASMPRVFNFFYKIYFCKENRKILKNLFGILIMFQIYALAGEEIGNSISRSMQEGVIDISFVFNFFNRIIEGIVG